MDEKMRTRALQMILDNIDEVVYVCDPDTHEILYGNVPAQKFWGDPSGKRCYEWLQRRDTPCPFCTNEKIFGEYKGRAYVWEFQNAVNHRWYRCIDKAIPWPDGREVRYEMAIDITDKKQVEEELERHRRELEERVEQRTQELRRANSRLQAQIKDGRRQREIIERQADEILEISTPVLQLWEGVVCAPLIGTLDSQRTQQFMEKLLTTIVATDSPIALVDITGVPTVDTQTAQHLVETISAVGLVGSQVILTGVQPAIAQTIVHLGVDLSDVVTRSSLAGGLKAALKILQTGDGKE